MKKSYLMMAAAATMLAACTQTDFVNEVPAEAPKAIEFEGGFVNKATRSENSNANYNETFSDHHSTFAVWAYKKATEESDRAVVFENEVVTVENGNYTYTNTAYWDKGAASYAFVAAAPATHNTWTLDVDNFKTSLNLSNVETHQTSATHLSVLTPEKSGVNQDLLISEDVIITPATHVGAVNLSFIHILSRLNVVLNNTNDKFRIISVTIKNLPSVGSFDEEKAEGNELQQGTHKRWTLDDSAPAKDYKVEFANDAQKKRGSNVHLMQTLVMPQEITDATTIEVVYGYDIAGGNVDVFTRTHTLAEVFGITGGNKLYFNEGWQNTLTLTVETTEITFSASVASWASSSQSTAHVIK